MRHHLQRHLQRRGLFRGSSSARLAPLQRGGPPDTSGAPAATSGAFNFHRHWRWCRQHGARTVVFIKGRPIGLDLDNFLCVRGVRPDSQGYTNSVRPFEAITELTVA